MHTHKYVAITISNRNTYIVEERYRNLDNEYLLELNRNVYPNFLEQSKKDNGLIFIIVIIR